MKITYRIAPTDLPTSGYDYRVRIEGEDREPFTEQGYSATFRGARRQVRRRMRRALGWRRYYTRRSDRP